MQPSRISFKKFIEQFKIGTTKETPPLLTDKLEPFNSKTGNEEIISFVELARPFEQGELPSIAVRYLLNCGYSQVTTKKSEDKSTTSPDTQDHCYSIFALHSSLNPIVIIVAWNKHTVSFTKHDY